MCSIINILILFFFFLIFSQIIQLNIIEGMETSQTKTNDYTNSNTEYKSYDGDDPLILSKQNAGNIEYLKQRMNGIEDLNSQVQDLSANLTTLQEQVTGLIQTQEDYTRQMTGGKEPEITGLGEEDQEKKSSDFVENFMSFMNFR
jgi:hypothetical protein